MFADKIIKDFIGELGSALPAPGGGAAAALAGSMGAALVSMVCNLTIGKKDYAAYEDEIKTVLVKAQHLQEELLALIDADADAFNSLMDSYKMPRVTEEEKSLRQEAIESNAQKAAAVPAIIATRCLDVVVLANQIAGKANKNLNSDILVAAEMAEAGLNSAIINIKINLPGIKDKQYVNNKQGLIQQMTTEFANHKSSIKAVIG
jgi:formiminotetrahydrofolate cyclodeaminase